MTTHKKHAPASAKSAAKSSAKPVLRPNAKPAVNAAASRKLWLIAAGVAVVIAIALMVATNGGGAKQGSGPASAVASTAGVSTAGTPSEEAKYIGRLLPAGYQEPKVADVAVYTGVTEMTEIKAAQTDVQISIPAAKLVESKIVYFEYTKPGSKPIPMMAYVKPSGKAFVGISYCPPCQGQRQRVDADLTLTCSSCGTKRNLETGVGISGACKLYPIDELPAKIVGGNIVVDRSAIDSWTPQPIDRKVG